MLESDVCPSLLVKLLLRSLYVKLVIAGLHMS